MGVTGLWKLIEPCGKPVPVETLEGKILAVDISIWLHQVVKGFQDNKGSALPNAHLLGLFNRLCKLLYYRVKPVFVFDGSVPQLKRDTIARRQQQRSKLNTEAERIQALLLQSLAKEKVVQQALGVNAELLLKSPSKRATSKNDNVDDMFKLPELPVASYSASKNSTEGDTSDVNDGSFTSLNSHNDSGTSAEDSSSFDESNPRHSYNANLQAIDVKSHHFRNLPADVRHEILVDIKETRKQSSWGRLHELPSRGDDFSVFQMKRLLKRRAVQESLQEAEQEMGGRTLTYAELSNLFTEEGILEENALKKSTKQICSDEHTRFLLVRDLKKKLSKKTEDATIELKKEEPFVDVKDEKKAELLENNEQADSNNKLGQEFDTELQLALAMSLEETQVYSQTDYCFESNEQLKLNRDQRKRLQNAAVGPARAYMIEYGGMNEEEVENIMEKTQTYGEKADQYIDSIEEDQKPQVTAADENEHCGAISEDQSESSEIRLHVSEDSETDSDFEEVCEKSIGTTTLKENNAIEIVVDPGQQLSQEDDIFADIFIPETESESFQVFETGNINEKNTANDATIIILDSQETVSSSEGKQNIITIPDSQDSAVLESINENEISCCKKDKVPISKTNINDIKPCPANSETILSSLKSQLDDIKNIKLDDIKVDTSIVEVSDEEDNKNVEIVTKTQVKTEVVEICDSDDCLPNPLLNLKSPKTPSKNRSILEYFPTDYVVKRTPDKKDNDDVGVAKVKSPFFVNKTPKSNGKRSDSKTNSSSSTPSKNSASKAMKSLFEDDANVENFQSNDVDILGVEPIQLTTATTEELLNEAAQMLKEQKTEDELKSIATNLANERRNLESERNRQDRMGMSINQRMSSECQELLRLFGIPYIVAPMEAEAQCAFLDSVELTNGTITDDSDIWLFGGRTVYKNFFAQNKHVLEFRAEKIENSFSCDRKKLIQLACLVGSDYTTGINGIGAVTALEILASFTPATTATSQLQNPGQSNDSTRELINTVLLTLYKFRDWWSAHRSSAAPIGTSARLALLKKLQNIELQEGFPSLAVVEAYLTPKVDDNREAFSWGYPDVESIRDYAKKTFGWTVTKTNEILNPVLKRLNERTSQATIRNYFAIKSTVSGAQIRVSKRVQKAIDRMSGKIDVETPEKSKPKGPTKKRGKKKETIETTNEDEMMVATTKITTKNTSNEQQSLEEQPSTSQQAGRPARKRAAVDLHSKKSDLIPQREKEKAKMLENKSKAAKILKQSQTTKRQRKS